MKHVILTTATAAIMAGTAGPAMAQYTLNILHINDLHSRIEPINQFDATCSAEDDEAGECFGGIARVKSAIDMRRDELNESGENVLVLDAGDQYQGSLFYTTYKGEAVVEFMNMIGFDAMAVGNHEFDDGPEGLAVLLDGLDFPILSGNIDVSEDEVLEGRVPGAIVLEIGSEQIGVVSVLAEDTDETSSPGEGVRFIQSEDYLKGTVDALEAAGINKIIALTHVGLPRDIEIARSVNGIDVIVGGHSHTLMANDGETEYSYPFMVENPAGREVPIVQAYAYSKYLGELQVTWDDEGNVTEASGDPILLDASVEPDEDATARVAELRQPIEELMSDVVGTTSAPIDGSRDTCRSGECQMGNLVADAMLDRVAGQGIDVAIQNGGGLRASIDEGEVTMGEVISVLPFQNTLATFELSGAGIMEALENGVGQVDEGAGRFPQVAGLQYTWDPEAPAGERITEVMVDQDGEWVPLDTEATYGVVTNNYMRQGGDGYAVFADEGTNAYDYGPGLEVVVADFIETMDGAYEPYTDGRISTAE